MSSTQSSPAADDVRKTLRLYAVVGVLLFCGTIATVLVATVPWLDVGKHGFDATDAILGLSIAVVKASLVALVFMHLNHERRLIYSIIVLAGMHATGMLLGTYWHFANLTHDRYFFNAPPPRELHHPQEKLEQ